MLALQDKNGNIDMTPQYISAITGMPVDDLLGCIERFMQPDPASRSDTEDGRRLTLIDPSRPWGWHVVNCMKYREKARKMGHDQRRQESGENAERMKGRRGDPRRPAKTRADPLSNTYTNKKEAAPPPVVPAGLNQVVWERWIEYRKAIKKPLRPASLEAAMAELAGFGGDQERVVSKSIANGWQGLFAPDKKSPPDKKRQFVKIGETEWEV